MLNFPFRVKLHTRKPLPLESANPEGSGLTTGKATVPCGMSGHTVGKDGQIVLNAESLVLDRAGNGQKKFSLSVHTQEVTGSSPVVSTKKFLISQEIRNFSLFSRLFMRFDLPESFLTPTVTPTAIGTESTLNSFFTHCLCLFCSAE